MSSFNHILKLNYNVYAYNPFVDAYWMTGKNN